MLAFNFNQQDRFEYIQVEVLLIEIERGFQVRNPSIYTYRQLFAIVACGQYYSRHIIANKDNASKNNTESTPTHILLFEDKQSLGGG